MNDVVPSGRSKHLKKIHNMMLAERRLDFRKIVESKGISRGPVVSILNDHCTMRKISAICPRLNTDAIV